METPKVLELIRPFDPLGADAEKNYDEVVRRVNQIRVWRIEVARELAELERQFVEGDLVIRSGRRRGEPLSTTGRRRRLSRMLELSAEFRRLNEQEQVAIAKLDRMNEALDRWARETYGD